MHKDLEQSSGESQAKRCVMGDIFFLKRVKVLAHEVALKSAIDFAELIEFLNHPFVDIDLKLFVWVPPNPGVVLTGWMKLERDPFFKFPVT